MAEHLNFMHIVSEAKRKGTFHVEGKKAKIFGWFAAANTAVILSFVIFTKGAGAELVPFMLGFGCIFPFISLALSKTLAIKAHGVHRIIPNNFGNSEQENLYNMVDSIRLRAGLQEPLEVGVYESDDVNAFAVGMTRKSSLVAFSTGLLEKMDNNEIAAVAAHEIAHIANGDMLTLTLVQAVVNGIVLLISLPFKLLKIASFFDNNSSWVDFFIYTVINAAVTGFLLMLGNLVVKAFSRKREFEADKLAASLLEKNYMISALRTLERIPFPELPKEQMAYASFRINSPKAMLDIFSTHPSLERRIAALESI